MSAISTRTFAEGIKKCLVLGGEEFVRPLAFGTNWNILRIQFSYAVTPNGTSNITGARFVVGLCSSTIQGRTYNSTNTTNYYGYLIHHSDESAGRTLVYTANAGNPYYTQGTDRGYHFTRVGNATNKTAIATGSLPLMVTTAGTIQRRAAIAFDILRPTSQGTGTAFWNTRVGCTMDTTIAAADGAQREVFYSNHIIPSLAVDSFSAIGSGMQWSALAAPGLAPDEAANGPLNAVSIFWNQSAFPIEIYELAAFRIR